MNKRKGLIVGLSSVAAVLAIGGAALLSGVGVYTQQSELVYMTDGPDFKNITDLTKASGAVAHVRILSAGKSYLVPFDAPVTTLAPAPKDGPKAKAGQQTSATPGLGLLQNGILKTDYTVEVLDNVRGAGVKKGQHIVISQLGGTITTQGADGKATTTVVANAEHDPVMQVGDEELLFLNRDAASDKFYTTGGGVGRFKVQSNGIVTAVDHNSATAGAGTGKSASFLKNEVKQVQD
jgi:hypothetical protein